MEETVELPAGWVAGQAPGFHTAMVNETWHRPRGLPLVLRYSWQAGGYCLYRQMRVAHQLSSQGIGTLVHIEGTPAFDDPIAAMIWAEVEYG